MKAWWYWEFYIMYFNCLAVVSRSGPYVAEVRMGLM